MVLLLVVRCAALPDTRLDVFSGAAFCVLFLPVFDALDEAPFAALPGRLAALLGACLGGCLREADASALAVFFEAGDLAGFASGGVACCIA